MLTMIQPCFTPLSYLAWLKVPTFGADRRPNRDLVHLGNVCV
jgi:hypothetical protein